MKKILFTLTLFTSFSSFALVENTMDKKFYSEIMKIEGKVFSGTFKDGSDCHVLVRSLTFGEKTSYAIPAHKEVKLMVSGEKLLDSFLTIPTSEEFQQELYRNYGNYPYNFNFIAATTGWCSNCGSAQRDGRLEERFNKRVLAFYAKGFTPSLDTTKIYLSKNSKSIKKVEMIDYKNWYIPVINYSGVKSIETCTIQ